MCMVHVVVLSIIIGYYLGERPVEQNNGSAVPELGFHAEEYSTQKPILQSVQEEDEDENQLL